MHPPSWEGVNLFRKIFAGGSKILILVWGLCCCKVNFVEGHRILKQNLKLHNPFIKSIFTITYLIHFRDIWKIHLLRSEKTSFSIAICCECLEHSVVFPVDLFLKQFISHVSANTLQLKFPTMQFFFISPGN